MSENEVEVAFHGSAGVSDATRKAANDALRECVSNCTHPNQTVRLTVWQCPDCGTVAEILPSQPV